MRADPAFIGGLGDELDQSMRALADAKPAPGADAGPSTAAVGATVAELMRAAAGLAETTAKTADDLHSNKHTYATVEDENVGLFGKIEPQQP